MTLSTLRSLRSAVLTLAAAGLTQAAAAQSFDAQIGFIEVTQAMPNTSLTAGRSTFVRVEALLTSPPSNPVDLDGIMRVFVNGVEAADSPVYSANGPFPAKTNPNFNVRNGTLNFTYLPPASNNVVFTIELNPAGPNFVPESNTGNNTKSTPTLNFQERDVPEFAYAPIDYRPGGGSVPNLPDEALIEPGVGDNFVQGIYPAKDIYYHRIDTPSILWTGDLTSSGSALLNALQTAFNMMSPKPDFLYGWVPGPLPGYNGQASGSSVSMGNTEQIRHQRTYAHEVGHNTGLGHTLWDIVNRGADQEHHLKITENLEFIKVATLRNIMDAGLLSEEAWVRDTHYEHFFNHPKFANPGPAPATGSAPALLVTGLWNMRTGALTIDNLVDVPPTTPTVSTGAQGADFEIKAYVGDDLARQVFLVSPTTTDSCATSDVETAEAQQDGAVDSLQGVPDLTLFALIPNAGQAFDRLEINPLGRIKAEPIVLHRSPSAPAVEFLTPGPGGDVSAGQIQVAWKGRDADGDVLTYYLRYTHDGSRFTPLATGLTASEWSVDMRQLPAFEEGVGYFELFASDGLNTTVLRSDSLVGSGVLFAQGSNPPWVHISTPDSGGSYEKATTVILHAQGWDLEDRALGDAAMVWTSDLDGVIATGRLTSVSTLSVGTHVLTVTGTDLDSLSTDDTTTITINDRGLPGELLSFYCTPGTSANGCQASLSAVGTPSATAPTGFTVTAGTVEGIKDGLFFFGTNGRQANSWGSGTSFQCVVPPTIRTATLTASGTLGACDGSASRDMNAAWTALPAKNPGSGAVVQLQFWYRDPQNTSNQTTSLSDAVEFIVEP